MTPLDWLMASLGLGALLGLLIIYLDGQFVPPQPLPPQPWWAGYEDKEDDVQQEEVTPVYGLPNVHKRSYEEWLEAQNIAFREGALYEDRRV